ncbi:MAG: histidinol-phosphate transaminase [Limnobacter sp.]|nr:histidinol-phosphate transaminase [Limnobacter sp.]
MNPLTRHAPDFIRQIAPYTAGKPISEVVRELGLDPARVVKLASNENPLGIGFKALQAIESQLAGLGRYPDSNGFSLKQALAAKHSVAAGQITLGNGSNDILELAAKVMLTAGSNAVFSQYAFAVYALAAQGCGAQAHVVPALNHGHDLPRFLQAIDTHTRVVFIANPNNPTGTFLQADTLLAFLKHVPSDVLVVLDEAYNEYLPPALQYDSTQWVERFPNLLVSRSFSKAHGLAGLRVGYAVSSLPVADLLNRVRQPFNVNALALAAAQASLADHAHLQKTCALNAAGLVQLAHGISKINLNYVPSVGNFVLFNVLPQPLTNPASHDVQVADAGQKVFAALQALGVIVRPVGAYGLPEWLRVSVGLPEENTAFLQALPKALELALN